MLDSRLAQAAKAAGIPQEGINGKPSDIMRNAFLEAMFGVGMITSKSQLDAIEKIPYSQAAGFGNTGGVSGTEIQTQKVNKTGLLEALTNSAKSKYNSENLVDNNVVNTTRFYNDGNEIASGQYTLADLLSGNIAISMEAKAFNNMDIDDKDNGDDLNGGNSNNTAMNKLVHSISNNISASDLVGWMADEFANVLNVDVYSQTALNYALMKTKELVAMSSNAETDYRGGNQAADRETPAKVEQLSKSGNKGHSDGTINRNVSNRNIELLKENNIGIVAVRPWHDNDRDTITAASINLSNLAQAYLSFFAQYMEGLSNDQYGAQKGSKTGQSLVTDDLGYKYTIYAGTSNTEAAKQALYYDTLFNQICAGGWLENDNITDNEHLQNLLQSGMAFITKPKDDGYYYQGNYSTDSYIKEITDDNAIAKAEAKYNTEKTKLNSKEQILDLKMKNLDTEISALTTEYDSVKSVISKNVEKSFKRYNA
jgi:hypothetical protein